MIGTRTRRIGASFLTLFALAMLGGCTTTRDGGGLEVKTAEEVAQSRFRARWWNYYDRAKAYEVLGEWKKAESDLRNALAKRSRDQRWARTYGLHFTPEYFPKRELGFVLYKLEQYEEALKYLEQSMSDQPTARAAYYLDECRAILVARSGEDVAPPQIWLVSPAIDEPVGTLAFRGELEFLDDTFVRRAWIDDEPVTDLAVSAEGPVTVPFTKLSTAGLNELHVRVEDITGKETATTFTFQTDHDGPTVSFDEPLSIPGAVSGVVYDLSGVDGFMVAGRMVSLEGSSNEAHRFETVVSQNDLAGPVLFRAVDSLNNVTQDALPTAGNAVARNPVQVAYASNEPEGTPVVLLAATEEDPRIDLGHLAGGRTTTADAISVHMDVRAAAPIASLELNGGPVPGIIPGRRNQRLARRISLEPGENQVTVTVMDEEGRHVSTSTTIIRENSVVDGPNNRLALALIGTRWKGVGTSQEISPDVLASELSKELDKPRLREDRKEPPRFVLVDRENLADILAEQELAALTKEVADRVQTGRIKAADLIVVGDMQYVDRHLGVTLSVIDSETSVVDYVDAFIPMQENNAEDATTDIVENLALLLEQLYPRVAGKVLQVSSDGSKVFTEDITEQDGVRVDSKCLVYRRYKELELSDGWVEWGYEVLAPSGEIADVNPRLATIDPNSAINAEAADVENLFVITK